MYEISDILKDDSRAYHFAFKTLTMAITFMSALGYEVETDYRCGMCDFKKVRKTPKYHDLPQFIRDEYIFRAGELYGFSRTACLMKM